MAQNETDARRLVARLTEHGIPARVEGAGVHWDVDVGPVNDRSVRVACFWYGRGISALMRGMNMANARSSLRQVLAPFEGAEFLVTLTDGSTRIIDGRTRAMDDVFACVRTWVSGASLDYLVQETPFIGAPQRGMRAFGDRLDPRLRWEALDDGHELWVYEGQRACCVTDESCSFLVGQAQLAFVRDSQDLPGDIATWLLNHASLADLAARGVQIERHAEVLEVDPARWHWLHVRDRIADPRDVLAPLAPLIEALASSPIASRFYTFSSLFRLCFSASSHYPWVGDYPMVWPSRDGEYHVDGVRYSLEQTIATIEATLARSPIEPFFGSEPDFELPLVAESLNRQGSTLKPEIIRRGMWSEVWLRRPPRRCRMHNNLLMCDAGGREFALRCETRDEAVGLAVRFLDESVTLDDLAANPRILPPVDLVRLRKADPDRTVRDGWFPRLFRGFGRIIGR